MLQSLNRLALASVFVLSAVTTAGAAPITINELATGGGTVVNDGSADVHSSDGSALGSTVLMSSLGLNTGNLANLQIQGLITDPFVQGSGPAVSANLIGLRLIGTVSTPCSPCATLDQVKLGSSLSGGPNATQNVLFAFALVGVLNPQPPLGPLPWTPPTGITSPVNVGIGVPFSYSLTQAQINFILSQMAALGYGTNQVRLGLAASVNGVNASGLSEPVFSAFEIQAVPEPATLLLLGTGLAAAGLRRVRRSYRH